ncbi:MAG: hypothetical protein IJ807_06435, partial [Eubacterium sp.]|nr:hypothetical protein [Eubacterium sp.]
LGRRMDSVCDPILDGTSLYIPLSEGVIACVDISKKSIVWMSKEVAEGHQTLGRLAFHEGYLYAGTWTSAGADSEKMSEGYCFCVEAKNGKLEWQDDGFGASAGFYWSEPVFIDDYVIFASEDGEIHISRDNINENGEFIHNYTTRESLQEKLLDEAKNYNISERVKIRSGLCYDSKFGTILTVSNKGTLYRIKLDFSDPNRTEVDISDQFALNFFAGSSDISVEDRSKINCTSTPVLFDKHDDYDEYAFTAFADGHGFICICKVYNGNLSSYGSSLCEAVPVDKDANFQTSVCPIIITKWGWDAAKMYFTANTPESALYVSDGGSDTTVKLFTPDESDRQYCLSRVVAGPDGTLYYSNDSGTLFAIGDISDIPGGAPSGTPSVSSGEEPSDPTTNSDVVVKKPSKVKYKKSNKKITVSWKQNSSAKTVIYIKQKNKKWKKLVTTSKKKYSFKTKKYAGKTIYLRLRSVLKENGKSTYSAYTKVKKFVLN